MQVEEALPHIKEVDRATDFHLPFQSRGVFQSFMHMLVQ